MRILLVEDDKLIGDGIKAGLSKMGFSIDWFTAGQEGKNALYSAPYDAAILDLTLPGIDGLDILREWRDKGRNEPVLILTARDALSQRVEGLQLGADDYLCKPFALIEVAARLEALIRRAHGQSSSELRHGKVTLDPNRLTASLDGESLALKPKEFALLELLMRNAGRVLPRKLIEEKLYNWDDEVSSNAVEVHVHHLRANSAAVLSAPCTASAIPWVTHETTRPFKPAPATNAAVCPAHQRRLGDCQRDRLAADQRKAG